jgi:putative transposase
LGLTTGLVPPRVDAPVKQGLLDLVAHAHEHAGWSLRQSASVLGIEHTRLLRWATRAAEDRLVDAKPGPQVPVHALLDWEREVILKLAEDWAEIDRSHRKLAHRGSRLDIVHVSESTVWRVLVAAGIVLPRSPSPRAAGQDAVAGVGRARPRRHLHLRLHPLPSQPTLRGRGARRRLPTWLSTCVSAEESSTQVEVAFTDALIADGKAHLLEDEQLLDELHAGVVPDNDERLPVLLAISDNGPQMTSRATAVFMAGARIAQHFGRPSTPNDQAWVESFFGHLKGEFPHLEKIKDAGELERELDRCRTHYNTVRLNEGIGYVTPDDEHHGRGKAIRAARRAGLTAAHQQRVATRRELRKDLP